MFQLYTEKYGIGNGKTARFAAVIPPPALARAKTTSFVALIGFLL
jgi:hypothetical protein